MTPRKFWAALLIGILLMIGFAVETWNDNHPGRYARLILAVGLLLLIAMLLIVSTELAHAHDPAHPELDGWYMGLQSKGGHPCCEGPGKDAMHLSDIDWDSKDGHYRVRIDGKWYDVPDNSVIEGPNRDGRAIVWGYPTTEYDKAGKPHITSYYVRCFIPGAGA